MKVIKIQIYIIFKMYDHKRVRQGIDFSNDLSHDVNNRSNLFDFDYFVLYKYLCL